MIYHIIQCTPCSQGSALGIAHHHKACHRHLLQTDQAVISSVQAELSNPDTAPRKSPDFTLVFCKDEEWVGVSLPCRIGILYVLVGELNPSLCDGVKYLVCSHIWKEACLSSLTNI